MIEEVSTTAKMREKITVRMAIIDPNIAAVLTEITASGIPVWGGGVDWWAVGEG